MHRCFSLSEDGVGSFSVEEISILLAARWRPGLVPRLHINALELLAVAQAVIELDLHDTQLNLFIDTTVLHCHIYVAL